MSAWHSYCDYAAEHHCAVCAAPGLQPLCVNDSAGRRRCTRANVGADDGSPGRDRVMANRSNAGALLVRPLPVRQANRALAQLDSTAMHSNQLNAVVHLRVPQLPSVRCQLRAGR
jgi:hypothetical protein